MNEQPNFNDVEFRLTQYLDGMLSPREVRALERQLAEDPALRAELHRYAALEERLASMGQELPREMDLGSQRADIMSALERKGLLQERPRRLVILRPVFISSFAAVAAAVIIALSAWTYFHPTTVPDSGRKSPGGESQEAMLTLVRPGPAESQAEMVVQRMDLSEIHLSPPENELTMSDTPPGTAMASVSLPRGEEPPMRDSSANGFPFGAEMR